MTDTVQQTRKTIEDRAARHREEHDRLTREFYELGALELEAQEAWDADRVLAVRQRGNELEHEIPLARASEVEALADLEAHDARQYADDPADLERVSGLDAQIRQLQKERDAERADIDGKRRRRSEHLMRETEHRHQSKLIRGNHE